MDLEVPGLLKNRMWKFHGSIKKEVGFQRVIQKELCGISMMGLGSWFLAKNSMDVTLFVQFPGGEASF